MPTVREIHQEAALSLLRNEQYDEAIALCDKLVEKHTPCLHPGTTQTEEGAKSQECQSSRSNQGPQVQRWSLASRITEHQDRNTKSEDSDERNCHSNKKRLRSGSTVPMTSGEAAGDLCGLDVDVIALLYKAECLCHMTREDDALQCVEWSVIKFSRKKYRF